MTISALDRLNAYELRLARIARERRPASTRKVRHCVRCGLCCWRRPPQLTLADLERLALRHEMSPIQFFHTYCVVDTIGVQLSVVLIRRGQEQYAGHWLPADETFSLATPCVYLDGYATCQVHDLKPAQCQTVQCWVPGVGVEPGWNVADVMRLGWDGQTK